MYTYAYKNNTNYSEYISNYSFLDFLLSDNFNFPDYLSILMQISLALHVAQQEVAFIHLDLYPWNIFHLFRPTINHSLVLYLALNIIDKDDINNVRIS